MRRIPSYVHTLRSAALFALASTTVASTITTACADSAAARLDDDDGGSPDATLPDASADASDDVDADARAPELVDACTSAGWCAIEVDRTLSFDDLWPLEDSAVAVASREGRSFVLVYEEGSWKSIHELPFLLVSVWASTEDVWVSGAGGYVAHGRRGGSAWTWTDRPLSVSSPVTVVWGTGSDDVYALADSRVWRLSISADGGPSDAAAWSVDYGAASAPEPEVTLSALVGRSENDIWVTGQRGSSPSCGLVAHKTAEGWDTVIDEAPMDFSSCVSSGGGAVLGGPVGKGASTADGELVALVDPGIGVPLSFIRIRHVPGEDVALDLAPRTVSLTSLWGTTSDDLYATRFSLVERGSDIWTDGGAWGVSTVAYEGIPITKPLHVVRGTRSDNVWVAGESYVFHKTSP